MIISSTSVMSPSKNVLKHSNPGRKLDFFRYWTFSDLKLCVLECVKEYIHWRNDRVDKDQKRLFIIYWKPYHAATIDTLQRWIKEIFAEINLTENVTPHTCRSASTTKAFSMSFESWSDDKTFLQHYKNKIVCYEGVDFNKIMEYRICNIFVIFQFIDCRVLL